MINLAGKRKTFLGFEKTDNPTVVKLKFKTEQGAYFYDKDLGNIKGEGFDGEIEVPLQNVVELYLALKTFEDSFEFGKMEESISFEDDDKKIMFYTTEKRPATIHIKGIDYKKKTSGILYVDVSNYPYVLLLAYMRQFLSNFSILSFSVFNINFSYSKDENLLLIYDKDLGNTEYVKSENLSAMKELFDNYMERGLMFTHSFTPDRNVFIDKEKNFHINDKQFDFSLFKKVAYLISI